MMRRSRTSGQPLEDVVDHALFLRGDFLARILRNSISTSHADGGLV
jgi:hypothetical protein